MADREAEGRRHPPLPILLLKLLRLILGDVWFAMTLPYKLWRTTTTYEAQQESMLPVILPGDRMQAMPIDHPEGRPLVRGDIIVFDGFHGPNAEMKRVVALPGDTIEIKGHKVRINGSVVDEPYTIAPTHGTIGPIRLAPGEYYAMGDNRPNSCDCRKHGPVRVEQIRGRVVARSWPLARAKVDDSMFPIPEVAPPWQL